MPWHVPTPAVHQSQQGKPQSPSERTLGANLLGDGGMVVLQDESLDVVSPAPFLLHCLGLGRHKEKEQGLLFQVKTA